MVETYQRRSALAHLSLALRVKKIAAPGVWLGEAPRRMILNLRGSGPEFTDSIWRITGLHLPKTNWAEQGNLHSLFWLGPDEYWLTGKENLRTETIKQIKEAFTGNHASVTDISETRTVISLSGKAARDVLMRGISIDLHPQNFTYNQIVQTSMGKVNILLHQTHDEPSYEIYALNSFADYCWRWLEKTSAPFGSQVRVQ